MYVLPCVSCVSFCIVLMFLLCVLSAVSFLKSEKYVSSPLALELPTISSVAQEGDPFYLDEVIDPDSTYPMAHVASMTELSDGTLAATWYAGSAELASDVNIYFSIKTNEK